MASKYVIRILGDDKDWKRASKGVQSSIGGIKNSVLSLQGLLAGLGAAISFRGVIDATIRQENAMRQLEQRVRSTGGAAGFTAPQLADMASSLQQVTTYGDEAVMEMQGLLLTFTQIRGPVFERTQEAILNVATAMGTDLKSAALQVGKALNDPKGQLTALSRSGIQFSDTQKELIRDLVDSGRAAEAQAVILGELETQFGGAARAAADTFGGALTQLSNAFGDLLEADDGLPAATESIQELKELLEDPATQAAFDVLINGIIYATGAATRGVVALTEYGGAIRDFFGGPDAPLTVGADAIDSIDAELERIQRRILEFQQIKAENAKESWIERALGMSDEDADREIARWQERLENLRAVRQLLVSQNGQNGQIGPTGDGDTGTGGGSTTTQQAILSEQEFAAAVKASEEAVKKENAEYQKWVQTQRDAAETVKESLDPTYAMTQQLGDLDRLLAMGLITWDEWGAATLDVQERIDRLNAGLDDTGGALGEFTELASQAARNIQDSFADFLFDPFEAGLQGMLQSFGETIRRMVAELAAQQALRAVFTSLAGAGGPVGSLFSDLAANVRHGGRYSTATRQLPALAFAGAPQLHSGLFASDEYPAVLQRGESVLTPEQMRALGGGANVSVHNYGDPGAVRVQRSQGPSGREQIDVVVADSFTRQLAQGRFDKSMRFNAGTHRPGVRR